MASEPGTRPVSFLYNGGPGSATIWLHMGSFSPVRVSTDSPSPTAGPPFKLVPNQYSLLDKTDLVFVDAPLTGFSRAVGKGQPKDLTGIDPDLRAFDRFIMRYLTVNQRWNSPKFLIGESYGTTRSAALADMLGNDGVQLNGVVLISSILNYNIRAGGYDFIYVANLPSYAAAAWYFDKIPNKPANVADWVQQARDFASGPYAQALFAGDKLPAAQLDDIAKQVSHFTGLSVDYVKEANLRISPTRFRKEVLRTDRRTLGRYDMRFEGEDVDAAGETPGYDASDTGISGAFVGAFHDYLENRAQVPDHGHLPAHRLRTDQPIGTSSTVPPAPLPAEAAQEPCSRSPTWPPTWPAPSARIPISTSSRPMATSTWPRPSSPPSTTSPTCTWSRSCAATSSSATTPPAT